MNAIRSMTVGRRAAVVLESITLAVFLSSIAAGIGVHVLFLSPLAFGGEELSDENSSTTGIRGSSQRRTCWHPMGNRDATRHLPGTSLAIDAERGDEWRCGNSLILAHLIGAGIKIRC